MTATYVTTPIAREDVNAASSEAARQFLSGAATETDARWTIAALVYASDIPETCVRRAMGARNSRTQFFNDTTDYVREQLTRLIVVAGGNAKLDLTLVAGGSQVSSWAQAMLSGPRVFPKKDWDTASHRRRTEVVDDETLSRLITIRALSQFHADVYSTDDEEKHELVDEFIVLSRGLRESEMVHHAASHIAALHRVGLPRRAFRYRNRSALLSRVESRVDATRQDLRFALDGVVGEDSLAVLFSNLDEEDVEAIVRLSPLESQALARSALTPMPPPRLQVVRALKDEITPIVNGQRAASQLVNAYVDVVAETNGSEFSPSAESRTVKTAEQRRADFLAWETSVESLLARGVRELGETPRDVLVSLSTRSRTIAVRRAREAANL